MIREIRYNKNSEHPILTWEVIYVDEHIKEAQLEGLEGGEYFVTSRINIDGSYTGWGTIKSINVLPMQLQSTENLVIKDKYSNSITLLWSQVPNAKNIIIEISLDGLSYSLLDTIDGTFIEHTINYLDISTEYFFRIKFTGDGSQDDYIDSPYSYITETTNSTIILLEDSFSGTTIDLDKHRLINPNSSSIQMYQDDEFVFNITGLSNVSLNTNRLVSRNSFYNYKTCIAFNIEWEESLTLGQFYASIVNSTLTKAATIVRSGVNARLIVQGIYDYTTSVPIMGNRWKIYKDESSVSFFYWNGSIWVQLGDTILVDFNEELYFNFTVNSNTGSPWVLKIDNLLVTDDNYIGLEP